MLEKYRALKAAHVQLKGDGQDPFSVTFDEVHSPTQAKLAGRMVTLFGSNNYLGLTFEQSCIERGAQALRTGGTGTTGARTAKAT